MSASQIGLFTFFEGIATFMNCQEYLMINIFNKHFEGTIFTNANRSVKIVEYFYHYTLIKQSSLFMGTLLESIDVYSHPMNLGVLSIILYFGICQVDKISFNLQK